MKKSVFVLLSATFVLATTLAFAGPRDRWDHRNPRHPGDHGGGHFPGNPTIDMMPQLRAETQRLSDNARQLSEKISFWAGIAGGGGKRQLARHAADFYDLSRNLVTSSLDQFARVDLMTEELRRLQLAFNDLNTELSTTAGGKGRRQVEYELSNISTSLLQIASMLDQLSRPTPRPPHHPMPPIPPMPPVHNPDDLRGFCAGPFGGFPTAAEFEQAKEFAYNSDGLNYTSQAATQWALDFGRSHACGTLLEFVARYRELYSYAESSSFLNMTSQSARAYAIPLVDTTPVMVIQYWKRAFSAIYEFAESSNYLNKTSQNAIAVGRSWNERGNCGDEGVIAQIKYEFRQHYEFAYSSNGLNMTSPQAIRYAVDKIRYMTPCSDLF